jgi:hypothetical protein
MYLRERDEGAPDSLLKRLHGVAAYSLMFQLQPFSISHLITTSSNHPASLSEAPPSSLIAVNLYDLPIQCAKRNPYR